MSICNLSRSSKRTWNVTTFFSRGWELTGKVMEYLVRMCPHESISTFGKFSTSLCGREVNITNGLDCGDSDKAKKLVSHMRRSRLRHMLGYMPQQDLGEDIDSLLIFGLRRSGTRRQIFENEIFDKNDNQKTSSQHQEQESDTSCCIFTWWSSGGIHVEFWCGHY